jgi:hypothetical protein
MELGHAALQNGSGWSIEEVRNEQGGKRAYDALPGGSV